MKIKKKYYDNYNVNISEENLKWWINSQFMCAHFLIFCGWSADLRIAARGLEFAWNQSDDHIRHQEQPVSMSLPVGQANRHNDPTNRCKHSIKYINFVQQLMLTVKLLSEAIASINTAAVNFCNSASFFFGQN